MQSGVQKLSIEKKRKTHTKKSFNSLEHKKIVCIKSTEV